MTVAASRCGHSCLAVDPAIFMFKLVHGLQAWGICRVSGDCPMRSFATIVLSGIIVFAGFFLFAPESKAEAGQYALEITLQENGETFDTPRVVVEQGKSYQIELSAGADYSFSISIPADTQVAAQAQFQRNLGRWAQDFIIVNTELSFEERPEAKSLPDYGKSISANLLLRTAEPQRAIRSEVPVADRGLIGKDGKKIETLSITMRGVPF